MVHKNRARRSLETRHPPRSHLLATRRRLRRGSRRPGRERPRPRRPRRHPRPQPHGVHRSPLRHDARRRDPGPAEYQAPRGVARVHRQGRQPVPAARGRRAPKGRARRPGGGLRRRLRRLPQARPVHRRRARPGRHLPPALHVRLHRPPEGRAADPRRPGLADRRARPSPPHDPRRPDPRRRPALPQECAGVDQGRHGRGRLARAAGPLRPAPLRGVHRPLPGHAALRRADHVPPDPERPGARPHGRELRPLRGRRVRPSVAGALRGAPPRVPERGGQQRLRRDRGGPGDVRRSSKWVTQARYVHRLPARRLRDSPRSRTRRGRAAHAQSRRDGGLSQSAGGDGPAPEGRLVRHQRRLPPRRRRLLLLRRPDRRHVRVRRRERLPGRRRGHAGAAPGRAAGRGAAGGSRAEGPGAGGLRGRARGLRPQRAGREGVGAGPRPGVPASAARIPRPRAAAGGDEQDRSRGAQGARAGCPPTRGE